MAVVRDKQNIFDVVLQETGGLNNAARLLYDNGLNFTEDPSPGSEVGSSYIESNKVKDFYTVNSFNPNNGGGVQGPEGGRWLLEQGFWDGAGVWTLDGEWKTL